MTSLRVFEVVHDQSEDDGLLTIRTVFGQISDARIPFCKINSALDFPQPIKYRACSVYARTVKDMEQLLQLQRNRQAYLSIALKISLPNRSSIGTDHLVKQLENGITDYGCSNRSFRSRTERAN